MQTLENLRKEYEEKIGDNFNEVNINGKRGTYRILYLTIAQMNFMTPYKRQKVIDYIFDFVNKLRELGYDARFLKPETAWKIGIFPYAAGLVIINRYK